jgi:hypothetical protein
MHKFHSIAALCGDGLRPELRTLFERLAIDPYSGLRIRHDGMIQAGPDPVSEPPDVVEVKPKKSPDLSLPLVEVTGQLLAPSGSAAASPTCPQEGVMNARLTFTRPNTLLGATTLAAWSSWACAAMTASAILTQSIGRVAADPLLSLSGGLYEVTSRLELPHLERWAIDKKTRICLFSHEENDAIPLPVLSDNNPFAKCSAANLTTDNGTFQYDIVCPGRDAAKAHAIYEIGPDRFAGRIAMVMGAKNMTMTEVQHAKRVGGCQPALGSPATRF